VIPDVLTRDAEFSAGGSAAWADASTIIPWTLHLAYGDTRILERQYESMKKWVEYMRGQAGDSYLWTTGFHFGDWLAFATTRSDYPGATTGKDLIATAFFARSTELLQRTAAVLGRDQDAAEYAALHAKIVAAFQKEFVTERGRVGENTQTAYALALQFGLLPESQRGEAARRLAGSIAWHDGHLSTGFVGTPYLCHVLSQHGQLDTAYDLLFQESYPSWLYPVKQGATTIWERWDGQKPDGTFQDAGMNSFNHYAYGAIGDWIYRVAAGIEVDPDQPGYKHARIEPQPGGAFDWLRASHQSLYGEVTSAWKHEADRFELEVRVPPNTHATVRLPGAAQAEVLETGVPLASAKGVQGVELQGSDVVLEVGSGTYRFAYPLARPARAK
jgi:alpha-L-rhamnosidase